MEILPIYQALLKQEEDGIYCVSLVDDPATQSNFMTFSKDIAELQKYSIQDDEKHIVSGVIMVAERPIYRRAGDFEFFVVFSKETLADMAKRMLKNGFQNNISVQHNGVPVEGVSLIELYIKDTEKGINPNFLDDVPEGSLIGSYKVENEELWQEIKKGEFKGFSIEALNTLEYTGIDMQKFNKVKKHKTTMAKLKEKLKKLLMEFASVETDKGTLNYDELAVGAEVFDENDEPAADGEYLTEEKVIVVAEGKITEIRDREVEETAEEVQVETEAAEEEEVVEETTETVEETVADEPEDELRKEIDELKAQVAAIREELDALKETVAAISNEPATESVVETFKRADRNENTGNKKIDNLRRIVNAR